MNNLLSPKKELFFNFNYFLLILKNSSLLFLVLFVIVAMALFHQQSYYSALGGL
jgi:hypothetical protein